MALAAQRGQQLVEQCHLARALDEPLEPRRVVRVLEALSLHDPLDEEGVVAAVAQLHAQVVEGGAADRALRAWIGSR